MSLASHQWAKVKLRYRDLTTKLVLNLFEKEFVIQSGDNLLSFQQSNGINNRSSACIVRFYDEDFKIGTFLRDRAINDGGIEVPTNLLESPDQPDTGSSSNFSGFPKEGTKGDELAKSIIKYAKSVGVTKPSHIATILANIQAETNMGQYMSEIGGEATIYAPFFGRGLIQITWESNYKRFGDYFKEDFVKNPDKVKEMRFAIPIAVLGMSGNQGSPTFTGLKLSDFDTPNGYDFYNSRRIVNSLDKADQIANDAKNWMRRLPELTADKTGSAQSGYFLPAALQPIGSKADPSKVALSKILSDKVIEIQIERGTSLSDDVIVTSYWYTSHNIETGDLPITTIQGAGIRALIQRENVNRLTFRNISLRQLTERIGLDYGLDTNIPGSPASEKILSKVQQNGENDFDLITRIAKSLGFGLQQSGTGLKLIRYKNLPKIDIKAEWGVRYQSSDSASPSRILKALPPIDSLIDGESIGEGFSTRLTITDPNIDVIALQPGIIVNIPKGTVYDLPDQNAFCREYILKNVSENYGDGSQITLELFIPVNVKPKEKTTDSSNSQGTKSNVAGTPNISVNWNDQGDRVSKYFKVSDVTNNTPGRVPPDDKSKDNAKKIGAELDNINDQWAVKKGRKPGEIVIAINSWSRPEPYNTQVGGTSGSQHLYGGAVDVRPLIGDSSEFEQWLLQNWSGAVGKGQAAGRGFTHLDLRDFTGFGKPAAFTWNY